MSTQSDAPQRLGRYNKETNFFLFTSTLLIEHRDNTLHHTMALSTGSWCVLWNQEAYHSHHRILQFTYFNFETIHIERQAYGITTMRPFATMTSNTRNREINATAQQTTIWYKCHASSNHFTFVSFSTFQASIILTRQAYEPMMWQQTLKRLHVTFSNVVWEYSYNSG